MAIISNGTTILDAGAFTSSLGSMVHIKTITASSSSTVNFVHGSSSVVFDSTYKIYVIKFINIHPSTDSADFRFNGSTDGGSSYNTTKTTTSFYNYHNEGDSDYGLAYEPGHDIAQGTGYCQIGGDALGADNDQCCSGTMIIYSPSSTTFVKNFLVFMNTLTEADYNVNQYTSGYMNTTNAVNAISFDMSTGNIDSGTFKLYGIKDS